MKKRFALLLAALLSASSAWAEDLTIKFSHVVAVETPKGQAALKFKSLVESRSEGKIKVEIYPNSQLFNDDKVLKALLLNDVQIAAPSLSKFSRYTKKLQVFDLPFLFDNMAAVTRFQKSETGKSLLTSMEKKGLVGLGYIHNGLKQMSANNPLLLPEDAKGKKFRIQSSDILAAQFEAVGAIPVKKSFSEMFTLLQTKAVDGTENPWSNAYSQKVYEVQSDITETNHGLLDYMVVTSKKFLDSLTPDQKKIVLESMQEAIDLGNDLAEEIAQNDRQKIIDSGKTKLHTLSSEQRAAWVKAMQPVWQKFENDIGKDVIEAAKASNHAQ